MAPLLSERVCPREIGIVNACGLSAVCALSCSQQSRSSHLAHSTLRSIPGHWEEGQTNRMQARSQVGRWVAYDSRTFPAVLTNDPTYYWATTATAACRRLSHLPSLTLAVPTPPHTNAVPSWQDHQAARSSLARIRHQTKAVSQRPRQAMPSESIIKIVRWIRAAAAATATTALSSVRPHVPPQSTTYREGS